MRKSIAKPWRKQCMLAGVLVGLAASTSFSICIQQAWWTQTSHESKAHPTRNVLFYPQSTSRGCTLTPVDTPVCVADNVCFEHGMTTFFVPGFGPEEWPWLSDVGVSGFSQESLEYAWSIFERRCCLNRLVSPSVKECVYAQQLGFSCCRQHYAAVNKPSLAMHENRFERLESAVVLDTGVSRFQFGHTISKMLQYASFAMWVTTYAPSESSSMHACKRPEFSIGIFSRISDEKLPPALNEWLEVVRNLAGSVRAATGKPPQFETLTHVIAPDGSLTDKQAYAQPNCFRRAYFVHDYEQYYFRRSDASLLNAHAEDAFGLPSCSGGNRMAWRRGMMLVRSEGSGGRRFINAVDVRRTVQRVLNLTLHDVSITSELSAAEQAAKFRTHGFILSPHSSQLKNLALACPCTIVVEVNALTARRAPFAVGLEHRNVVYAQSSHHTPQFARPPPPLALTESWVNRSADVVVDLARFEIELIAAVEKHRNSGCHIF
jgi:hypothetical protein